jgi:hypothetical protein
MGREKDMERKMKMRRREVKMRMNFRMKKRIDG